MGNRMRKYALASDYWVPGHFLRKYTLPPISTTLELTDRWNQKCQICPQWRKNSLEEGNPLNVGKANPDLNLQEIKVLNFGHIYLSSR